jgi:DNA-binding PadR family transcriptional regulator
MQSESLMLYKLIILYILDRMDFPITNTELTRFILEKEYCNYITIQQTLEDLIEDRYVEVEHAHNSYLYRITASGKETLSFFYTRISVAIRDDIDAYLSEKEYQLREMVSTTADYYEAKKNEFVVELRVIERDSELVHINLLVTSAAEADIICNRWKECSADVYGYLITTLAAGPQGNSK